MRRIAVVLGEPRLPVSGGLCGLNLPQVPDEFYLPFTKELGAAGYAHVVVSWSYVARDLYQYFDVLLLRYPGSEPWQAWAIPVRGEQKTNIAGWLPMPGVSPLPLVYDIGLYLRWHFRLEKELRSQLRLVRQQLEDPVLPWLENPLSTYLDRFDDG